MTNYHFKDYLGDQSDISADVLNGLSGTPKRLPPKLFYDAQGSVLFDKICTLPEYYPTRVEQYLLEKNAPAIANILGKNCLFIELGSGNCQKSRAILSHVSEVTYLPIDISKEHLQSAAKQIAKDYPKIEVYAVCLDFLDVIQLPREFSHTKKVFFFSGSSIGNLDPQVRENFLENVAKLSAPQGGLLIGIDLQKDKKILHDAYNDTQGVTAKFNLNVLTRINRELRADFSINQFTHWAFYNEQQHRIEMHLKSLTQQSVTLQGRKINFQKDETIHTENSYKFTTHDFQELAYAAGFRSSEVWQDAANYFSLHYYSF